QRRARGHDLGAADIDTPVGLLVHVDAHVGTFVNGAVPVHWGMNDGMVEEKYLFLCLLIPYSRIGLVRRIKRCIGSQGAEKGPFVVWCTPHPAVRQTRPGGDRVARGELFLPTLGGPEIAMGIAPGASVCVSREHCLQLWVMQGIVQAGDHAG